MEGVMDVVEALLGAELLFEFSAGPRRGLDGAGAGDCELDHGWELCGFYIEADLKRATRGPQSGPGRQSPDDQRLLMYMVTSKPKRTSLYEGVSQAIVTLPLWWILHA
jgi:hypothetical protein